MTDRIFVAGHHGLGSSQILTATRQELDLALRHGLPADLDAH